MRLKNRPITLHLEHLEPRLALSNTPLITEFMASNNSTLADGDHSFSDWIEIHNPTAAAIDLAGWHLTDDVANPGKWSFPSLAQSVLDPGEYLVVFASGQSSETYVDPAGNLHTNFSISAGGEYLALTDANEAIVHEFTPQFPSQETDISYGVGMFVSRQTLIDETSPLSYLIPTSGALGTTWTEAGFDDTAWSSSPAGAGIGYENNPGASVNYTALIDTTVPSGTTSLYTRFEFNLTDPNEFNSLTLRMMYDDGYVAYLNGEFLESDFAPGSPQWNSIATGGLSDSIVIDDFVETNVSLSPGDLVAGTNVLAIHSLNLSGSSDMLMITELIGESSEIIEPIETGFFQTPTPGLANGLAFDGFVEDTTFSVDRGFFSTPFDVAITTNSAGANIYYTTDGSAPSETNGTLYTGPINISETTPLRAMATLDGYLPTNVDTHSYIFLSDVITEDGSGLPLPPFPATSNWDYEMDPNIVNDPRFSTLESDLQTLPTLSLVMDEDDAWGTSGFYATLTESQAAERPVSVELIDTDGVGLFQEDAGIRVFGSGSLNRALGKKSMRLVFRSNFGPTKLNYPFFGPDRAGEINTIAIRGNYFDTWTFQSDGGGLGSGCCGRSRSTYLRDQFAHESHEAMGAHAIAGNFVHLYINGIYWGLFNPTERPDEEFMQSYFGGADTDYDIIKTGVDIVSGDLTGWNEMFAIARGSGPNGSLANNAAYEDLKQYLDIDDFIDYMLVNFYGGNNDWPHNNWYVARNRANAEPFRFYEWDAENFLFNVNSNRTGVSNSNTAGELYSLLRQNDEFNLRFADRVQTHMFNEGALTVSETTARFQHIVDTIRPALNAEAARWGDELQEPPHNTFDDFDAVVAEKLNNYFPVRTGIVLNQLLSRGLYPSTAAPSFNQHGGHVPSDFDVAMSAPSGALYYTLDGSDPRDVGGAISATAIQYTGTPIDITAATTVRARARDGGIWSALNEATFTLVPFADATNLRITELHYNPAAPSAAEIAAGFVDNDEFEFIELLNIGTESIELQQASLLSAVDLTFNNSTLLLPGERVVAVENQAAFQFRYGTSIRIIGQWSGGLNNGGETLVLHDQAGQTIHSFTYEDGDGPGEEAWPTTPDGMGPSLVVVDTEGDYSDGTNWIASTTIHGTPGAPEAATPGDFDSDGDVDGDDLIDWQSGYGTSSGANRGDGDADEDGDVDGFDFLAWQRSFTGTAVVAALASVSAPVATSETAPPEQGNTQGQQATSLDLALAGLQWTALHSVDGLDADNVPPVESPTDQSFHSLAARSTPHLLLKQHSRQLIPANNIEHDPSVYQGIVWDQLDQDPLGSPETEWQLLKRVF